MYDPECSGGYECEAWSHAPGCLSHTIDPPSELQVAAIDATDDATVQRLIRRGSATVWRDEP